MIPYRRDALLRELGLGPLWRLRSAADVEAVDDGAEPEAPVEEAPRPVEAAAPRQAPAERLPSARPPLGVNRAESQPADRAPARSVPPPSPAAGADPERIARIGAMDWDALEAEIRACRACRLCEKRHQAVPGVGDRKARWLFVGEGPGSEEDKRGEPFVGAAGRLLDNMLASVGLQRGEDVYIANAVKCRPPHNRTPEADEIAACLPFLARQIELLQPQLIVALGRPAAQALLETEVRIGAARGKRFDYCGIPVVVTYHPAYLLRNQWDKAKAWEDLCFARREMATLGSKAETG